MEFSQGLSDSECRDASFLHLTQVRSRPPCAHTARVIGVIQHFDTFHGCRGLQLAHTAFRPSERRELEARTGLFSRLRQNFLRSPTFSHAGSREASQTLTASRLGTGSCFLRPPYDRSQDHAQGNKEKHPFLFLLKTFQSCLSFNPLFRVISEP